MACDTWRKIKSGTRTVFSHGCKSIEIYFIMCLPPFYLLFDVMSLQSTHTWRTTDRHKDILMPALICIKKLWNTFVCDIESKCLTPRTDELTLSLQTPVQRPGQSWLLPSKDLSPHLKVNLEIQICIPDCVEMMEPIFHVWTTSNIKLDKCSYIVVISGAANTFIRISCVL